jgi:hypothetical protein
MITDEQIRKLFNEFIESPELDSWRSDLSAREEADAQRLFRQAVQQAIIINSVQREPPVSGTVTSSPAAE